MRRSGRTGDVALLDAATRPYAFWHERAGRLGAASALRRYAEEVTAPK